MASRKPAQAAAKQVAQTGLLWCGLNDGDLVLVDAAPLIHVLQDHPQYVTAFVGLFEIHERSHIKGCA